tara:strand:+ start:556 stop:891 length:336 start_codon:yes stop_codon:yes gene_type:complete
MANNKIQVAINGNVVAYEGNITYSLGKNTTVFNPQTNGKLLKTVDISSAIGSVTIPVRCTPENVELFRSFESQENVVQVGDISFSGMEYEVFPDIQDLEVIDFVFKGNPAV